MSWDWSGASAALSISHIPVVANVATVRVGYIDGQYVLNPTFGEMEKSSLDLVVAGTRQDIVMVEGGADELPGDLILGALEFALKGIGEIIDVIDEITRLAAVEKKPFKAEELNAELRAKIRSRVEIPLDDLLTIAEKQAREETYSQLVSDTIDELAEEYPEMEQEISSVIGDMEKEKMRAMVLETGRRVDGRGVKDIRTITLRNPGSSPGPRFCAFHARPDSGPGFSHSGHERGQPGDRFDRAGGIPEKVHAALQLPLFQCRRGWYPPWSRTS